MVFPYPFHILDMVLVQLLILYLYFTYTSVSENHYWLFTVVMEGDILQTNVGFIGIEGHCIGQIFHLLLLLHQLDHVLHVDDGFLHGSVEGCQLVEWLSQLNHVGSK